MPVRAVLVLVHGWTWVSHYYEEFAKHMNKQGEWTEAGSGMMPLQRGHPCSLHFPDTFLHLIALYCQ